MTGSVIHVFIVQINTNCNTGMKNEERVSTKKTKKNLCSFLEKLELDCYLFKTAVFKKHIQIFTFQADLEKIRYDILPGTMYCTDLESTI